MKFKLDSDVLLTVGLIGGLGAAAYFWWQSMQMPNIFKLTPADYAFTNSPGGTVIDNSYVPVGGANIRPLTPSTNPAGG